MLQFSLVIGSAHCPNISIGSFGKVDIGQGEQMLTLEVDYDQSEVQ